MPKDNNKDISVTYFRAFACLLVIATHVQLYVNSLAPGFEKFFGYFFTYFGAIGVDLFFVLSGYILFYSCDCKEKSVSGFLLGRFVRIYPLYFVVLIISALIFLFKTGYFPVDRFLGGLALFPYFDRTALVGVAWTLIYELYFYLVLALFIRSDVLVKIFGVLIVFLIGVVFGGLLESDFFSNLIVFEFSMGMLVYFWRSRLGFRYSKIISLVGIVAFFIYIFKTEWVGYEDKFAVDRFFVLGTGAFFILAAILNFGESVNKIKFLELIGDASYSMYLTHFTVVLPFAGWGLRWMVTPDIVMSMNFGLVLLYVLFFALSVISGVFFYKYVEIPLAGFLKRLMFS